MKQQRDNNGILIKEDEYNELNEKLKKYEENKKLYEKILNEKRNQIRNKENLKDELTHVKENVFYYLFYYSICL